MIRLLRLGMVAVSLLAVSGCASLVTAPRVTILSTNIVSVDTSGFDIELLVGVENRNAFDVSLIGYTYDLQVMSVPFSSGGLQKGALFPAGQTVDIRLPFRVHHSDIAGILKRRPDLDHIPYSIDARLNLETPVGQLIIPVKKSDTVSIPAAYRPGTYFKRLLQPLKEML